MTAPVSYINLMKAQRRHRHPFMKVAPESLSVKDILDRGRKARAALGTLPTQRIVKAEIAPAERHKEIAAVVVPHEPLLPVVIVVTQESIAEEDERSPIISMPSWKAIVHEVSKKHGVAIVDILSVRRSKPYVNARYEAMYRLRHETTMSYPAIGRRLGGRDHTTVIHGVKQHERRMREAAAING